MQQETRENLNWKKEGRLEDRVKKRVIAPDFSIEYCAYRSAFFAYNPENVEPRPPRSEGVSVTVKQIPHDARQGRRITKKKVS